MLATRTFLFSDLREYTAFVERHGDAAAKTLIGDYRRIVRAEIAKHEGAEIKTEGDSFYVVFHGARAAVMAGLAILREADRYSREHADRPMQVGVGVHAGEPQPHEGQYVGSAVIVAARLAQTAAAGELLVSDVVRGLLPRDGAPAMRERAVALKGIVNPPTVFSVARAAPPERGSHQSEVSIPAAEPHSRQILCPEIIGRATELTQLESLLAETAAGHGRTVLVSGEAGLGKTALVGRFAEQARADGARWLAGECTEIEARRPFGPFIDALVTANVSLPRALARGGPGAQLVAEADRYQVHAEFAELLSGAAATAPLVLAIEDLHWADEASQELFPYLARKLRDQRILLLGTYRSDELHRRHPLNHVLAELARGRLATEVKLHRLSLEELGDMVRRALGLSRAPTQEFRQALFDRTEGNPFFVEEILRALVENGELEYRDGSWRRTKDVAALTIPVSVADAVQRRLLGLTQKELRVLQVAAVIGQHFEFDLLREVAGLTEDEGFAGVRAAMDAQLLAEERNAERESYRFRHALSREAVLADLFQRERTALHRTVAEVIERDSPERVEDLAYHFGEARDPRAFRYHDLAASEADRAYAFARAVHHLDRAIELAPEGDPIVGPLLLRLADAARVTEELLRGLRAAQRAQAVFAATADTRGVGAALERIAQFQWSLGRTADADAAAAEAVRVLEALGPSPELAAALQTVARYAVLGERHDDAITWGERAVAMARATGATEVEANALGTVGMVTILHDRELGLAKQREGARIALDHDLVWTAQRLLHNIFASRMRVGTPLGELLPDHEAGLAHGKRSGAHSEVGLARDTWVALSLGEWDRARANIEDSSSDSIWSAQREVLLPIIITAREGPERGFPRIEPAFQRLVAAALPQWRSDASLAAISCWIGGDARATLRYAEVAADLVQPDYYPPPNVAAVLAIAAARQLGDGPARERWLDIATRPAALAENAHAISRRAYAEADGLRAAGDVAGALERLAESVRVGDDQVLAFPALTQARLDRAELLASIGDPLGAREELERARVFWRKAKAMWYLARLEAWAAEHGIEVASRA